MWVWVGNSYDLLEIVRIVFYVMLFFIYDLLIVCFFYGYIFNIFFVYVNVYVLEMCVNIYLYKIGVFRIKIWFLKMKKVVKLVCVCVVELLKRSFDFGIWFWNIIEWNCLWY